MPLNTTYRPHNPGHDYYDKGIYLITLVVTNRDHLLSELNMVPQAPDINLTELGKAIMQECERIPLLQAQKGREYYDSRPRTERPLFDDNYDDTICLDQRHRDAMLRYVHDNPRRAILMKCNPTFMQRLLHIQIAGKAIDGSPIWRDYAAFGNLFLLRWAQKLQVFCHRSAIINGQRIPYEQTTTFQRQHDEWIAKAQMGATVLVTLGISKGESIIKTECIEQGIPLIHLQAEPINRYWKPEFKRFNACQNGTLLILAPWNPDAMGDVDGVPQNTQYAIFHNMNTLAAEICDFEGQAKIVSDR